MMIWKARVRQRWLGATSCAIVTLLLGLVLYFRPVGQWAIFSSYDIPFGLRATETPTNVVLVYLDHASYVWEKANENEPWDRARHAEMVKRLTAAGATAIIFDVLFTDPGPTNSVDAKLAAAFKANGHVVLGGEWLHHEGEGLQGLSEPIALLTNAAAGWGLVQYDKQLQGPREHLRVIEGLPSLAWVAAKVVGAPVTKTSTQDAVRRWINYYGRPGTIPSKSYVEAYYGDGVPPDFFRGKIVFIGSRQSTGFQGTGKDEFPTAYTWLTHTYSPGTEIHATVLLNLLRQDWLTRLPAWLEVLLLVVTGLSAGFLLSILYSKPATLAALLSCLLVMVTAWLLFRYELLWFTWLILVVQLLFALFWSVVFNSIQSYAERKVLENSLALHLPARRVKQILKSPELLTASAEKQEVSLMFTDIADWSTISERITPDRLFKLLNKYFQETIPCVHAQEGMVLQLTGDAIFAIWNAPEPQKNHHEHACAAALKLRDQLVQFESANESYPLRTRVGLHCGLASVGNCGSADRLVYTALGAETNMASRLEGLNKYLGTQILASDRIEEAVEDKFTWRNLGRFRLKGGDRVMEIYELVGGLDAADATRAWRQSFGTGLRHFQRAEWDEAVTAFSEVMAMRKDDGPSRFYLRQIEKLRTARLPEKWFGEVSMDEK